jgi:hypothetical protein
MIGRLFLSVLAPRRETIRKTADAAASTVSDVGVDHCCFDVAVAQQLLHRADVVAGGQQVRAEGMTKRMAGDQLRQADLVSGLRYGLLDERFVDVVWNA